MTLLKTIQHYLQEQRIQATIYNHDDVQGFKTDYQHLRIKTNIATYYIKTQNTTIEITHANYYHDPTYLDLNDPNSIQELLKIIK